MRARLVLSVIEMRGDCLGGTRGTNVLAMRTGSDGGLHPAFIGTSAAGKPLVLAVPFRFERSPSSPSR